MNLDDASVDFLEPQGYWFDSKQTHVGVLLS